ncbi:MAG: PPOX class F420-dependent oxidoreductase [Gammaproteobacteria bacterium]|nr:PPOX class F420-dependent oxidoreductase [Gammaproteobacteria bacterium]
MKYSELDASERQRLHDANYLNLGTFRRDGTVVRTPVWFAEAEGCFWVFTAGNAGKVKRLNNDPRCEIARCDAWGGHLGPWVEAHGERVPDAKAAAEGYRALRAKYGWQMLLTDVLSRLSGRFHQRAMLRIRPAPEEDFGRP